MTSARYAWRKACRDRIALRRRKITDGMRIKFDQPLTFQDGYSGDEFVAVRGAAGLPSGSRTGKSLSHQRDRDAAMARHPRDQGLQDRLCLIPFPESIESWPNPAQRTLPSAFASFCPLQAGIADFVSSQRADALVARGRAIDGDTSRSTSACSAQTPMKNASFVSVSPAAGHAARPPRTMLPAS